MTHLTSTTFHLARDDSSGTTGRRLGERQRVTISPMRCPMFHDLPDEIRQLVDEGWRITGHVDSSKIDEHRGAQARLEQQGEIEPEPVHETTAPPEVEPPICPGCGRRMSYREADEQGACNDCQGGAS